MRKLLLLPLAVILAGCNTTNPIISTQKLTVVVPDNSLYNCPIYRSYPNINKLTDVQVARVIVNLYKNNEICKNSIESIRLFLENSKKKIESDK